MGWGEVGNAPHMQGMWPAPFDCRFSPSQVAMPLCVVSWVISLPCVSRDAAHWCEMPKSGVAIWRFCPRRREGNAVCFSASPPPRTP